MLTIVVAPDSFKESVDAIRACELIEKGIKKILPYARVIKLPVSDGGEGITMTLVNATGGRLVFKDVTGPLGDQVRGYFGVLGDGTTAVVEVSVASGLHLVPAEKRNPFITTTRGTGELIRAAVDEGCKKIIVGLGGSATNDGGVGMAQALGASLTDASGKEIEQGAQGVLNLDRINMTELRSLLSGINVIAACDVDNPLCGPRGAARVYGPQKGATGKMVEVLDFALRRLSKIIWQELKIDVLELPGSGAAGGMGAGLVAFANASLWPGIDLVLETVKLEELIAGGIDLVITGEGEINSQTVYGKVPVGVARVAAKYEVPVIALVGSIADDAEVVYEHGIEAIMSIVPRPMMLDQALEGAEEFLVDGAARAMRLINMAMSIHPKHR